MRVWILEPIKTSPKLGKARICCVFNYILSSSCKMINSLCMHPYSCNLLQHTCECTCTHTHIHTHTHTMEYYSAIKQNEILPFAAAWMDLENIILSEVSQAEKDKYYMLSLIHGISKIIQMNLCAKQKQTHRPRKHSDGYPS